MSSNSSDGADAAAAWFFDQAHFVYEMIVALYARGFGATHAHTVVGNVILLAFALMTALCAWYVFKEVADIGFKMLRVVLMVGVVALMVSMLAQMFSFVYPTSESREAVRSQARAVVEHASDQTTSWFFSRLWKADPAI